MKGKTRGGFYSVMADLVPAINGRAPCNPNRYRRDRPGDNAMSFAIAPRRALIKKQ